MNNSFIRHPFNANIENASLEALSISTFGISAESALAFSFAFTLLSLHFLHGFHLRLTGVRVEHRHFFKGFVRIGFGAVVVRHAVNHHCVFLRLAAAVVHAAQVGRIDAPALGVDVECFEAFGKLAALAFDDPHGQECDNGNDAQYAEQCHPPSDAEQYQDADDDGSDNRDADSGLDKHFRVHVCLLNLCLVRSADCKPN